MSCLKKLVIAIIISILVIIGYQNISSAYNIGDTVELGFGNYNGSRRLFCIEHGQHLYGEKQTYKVVSKVHIRGRYAWDHTGKQNEDNDSNKKGNAKLAYILAHITPGNVSEVRKAIWKFMGTWVGNIGRYMAGLYEGFAGDANEGKQDLNGAANEYAKSINKTNTTPTNNTVQAEIKVKVQELDGTSYIKVGPFKWTFPGTMDYVKVYNQNGKRISNVKFGRHTGGSFHEITESEIKSGKNFYLLIPMNTKARYITRMEIKSDYTVYYADIDFLKCLEPSWQNLIWVSDAGSTTEPATGEWSPLPIPLLGDINIMKVITDDEGVVLNSDNEPEVLNNIGFKFRHIETNKYVRRNQDGSISYTSDINNATEFITGVNGAEADDGKIIVRNVLLGDYEVIETTNPHYGYSFEGPSTIPVTQPSDNTSELIGNKQQYIQLSGYVYLDVQSSKQAYRNNLYRSDINDDTDQLLSGVKVRLVDRRTGATVLNDISKAPLEAYTTDINLGDGIIRYYRFTEVKVDELANYYVEFTYDGLTYQNVQPIEQSRLYDYTIRPVGSVAAETAETRDAFNREFSTIEGSSLTTGVSKNEYGQVTHNLSYNFANRKSTLINNGLPVGQYPIISTTDVSGYNLASEYQPGKEEIPYINLGLFEREKPDLVVVKDVHSAKLEINGYNHIYKYGSKIANKNEYIGGFNVGVQFGSEYGTGAYTRPVYKADAEYTNPNDRSRELKVYVTYAINITNQSTAISTRINQVVDYFDSRYTFVSAGTGIDESTATVTGTGNVNCEPVERYSDKYSKLTINASSMAEPSQNGDTTIYVQFELGREAVVDILNDKANLDNVAEITSYSSFQGGKAYAGVDIDSNPGNTNPENNTTYEDDTDISPSLKLVLADARELAGAVFEDKAESDEVEDTTQLMTGKVREGNSEYDEDEPGIGGVDITFKENKRTGGMTYKTTTVSEDGVYTFRYTYQDANGNSFEHNAGEDLPAGTTVTITPEKASGSTEGTVRLLKGDFFIEEYIPGDYTLTYTWGDEIYTVQNYKGTVYDKTRYDQNVADKEWYKKNEDRRLTDAVDDYALRQEIDAELQNITNSTQTTIDKMNSSTPTMGIGIEKGATTSSGLDKLVYKISNVDFGIIERARQDIVLTKRVTAMKVTLANGRTLVDMTIGEDGSLNGTTSNVMYLPPSTAVPQGIIRLEMDDELMGGASLEIEYTITATNNSELDYVNERFYKYGIEEGEVATITPSGIVDYLDVDWEFDATQNPDWEATDENDARLDLAQTVKESREITNRKIVYTDALAREKIKPTEKADVKLNVSKLMTSSEDIELDNETEIVEIDKTSGGYLYLKPPTYDAPIVPSIPGNYEPGSGPQVEHDDDMAERVIITSNTGENLNFILPISIIVSALVIIGVGAIFIKKKVLNK